MIQCRIDYGQLSNVKTTKPKSYYQLIMFTNHMSSKNNQRKLSLSLYYNVISTFFTHKHKVKAYFLLLSLICSSQNVFNFCNLTILKDSMPQGSYWACCLLEHGLKHAS